jgi:hypothetical protein
MHQQHEWAHELTNALCWPYERGARLYCGSCADDRQQHGAPEIPTLTPLNG